MQSKLKSTHTHRVVLYPVQLFVYICFHAEWNCVVGLSAESAVFYTI